MEKKHLIGYPIVAILVALITFYCTRKEHTVDPVPVKPKEIISFKDAVQLYRSYSDNRACAIKVFEGNVDGQLDSLCPSDREADKNFKPARSFYLSKEFLDNYIAYIKKVTPDSIDVTGYRLYLGNYPDKDEFDDGKPIPDPRRNTVFIAPTTLLGNDNLHRGFTFVDRNNDGKRETIFLEDEFKRNENIELGITEKETNINTASFFSFFSVNYTDLSTIANDLGSYP